MRLVDSPGSQITSGWTIVDMASQFNILVYVLVSNGTHLYLVSNPISGSYVGYAINLGVVTFMGNFHYVASSTQFLGEKDGIVMFFRMNTGA